MSERLRVATVRARRARQATAARLLGSRLLRWRYGRIASRTIAIAPRDIRPVDRMFWSEIEAGFMGLAGDVGRIGNGSPFEIQPPSRAWLLELHGFSWLRHIEAAENREAEAWARGVLLDWLSRGRSHDRIAAEPVVRARRIVSLLSAATYLFDVTSPAQYETMIRGLAHDVTTLSAQWRIAGEVRERLTALTALTIARVAFEEEDEQLESVLNMLCAEIAVQVLPDGGHVSRNPAALIDLLLDWLPLKSCFEARGFTTPPALLDAIERTVGMVRFLRLGDGGIARFNGMGVSDASIVATLLAYDEKPVPVHVASPSSRYVRLERGGTILIADAGGPPRLDLATEACAGCLSIEVSVDRNLLFVNMGAPGPADADWSALSRATASHSTATLGETSSATLVSIASRGGGGERGQVSMSGTVRVSVQEADGGVAFEASHEGYLARHGLIHRRVAGLDAMGTIVGVDHFEPKSKGAGADEVAFAIHFLLHPSTVVEPSSEGMTGRIGSFMLRLQDGSRWRFEIAGAISSIEESIYLATRSGPAPALRIVARGIAVGAASVEWSARRDVGGMAGTEQAGDPASATEPHGSPPDHA